MFKIQFFLSIVFVFHALIFPANLHAQIGGTEKPVKWVNSILPPTGHKVGDIITLKFDANIEKGWHLYSVIPPPPNKVAGNPTTLELDKIIGATLVGKLEENGNRIKEYSDIFEVDEYYFKGKVTFTQKIKLTSANPEIIGYIKFQVCTEEGKCIYPKNEFSYKIQASGEVSEGTEAPITNVATADTANMPIMANSDTVNQQVNTQPVVQETSTEGGDKKSNFSLFITAFIAGLLALITPCVFPMIPMTVSFFTKRSKNRAQGIQGAMIYAASIIFIFVVLGLLITILFGAGTLYNLSTNPWMNLFFFGVIFAFGLSFLGMFEIALPSSWMTKIDEQSGRGGIAGIFFMALTLVLASFSCTGPIAGYLLVDAATGSLLGPTVGMLGFSMGFAIPFGLFAVFPGWMNGLPRSGGWLNSVKVVLGFLELALCLKFFSQADLKWHLGILDREIFLGIWIVIFSMLGFYLLGKIRLPHDTPLEKVSVGRVVLSIISFSFVLYMIPGLWGAPLEKFSGLFPPPNNQIGVRLAPYYANNLNLGSAKNTQDANSVCEQTRKYADLLAEHAPDGFCMFYDLEEARAYAKKVNKPLFIDFTGHTCANCREMEHKVWPDAEVKRILNQDMVMVSLYVDEDTKLPEMRTSASGNKLRTIGDLYQDLQQTKYNQLAQPYYVITHPTDDNLTPLVPGRGYTPDIKTFADFLKAGLEQYKSKSNASAS